MTAPPIAIYGATGHTGQLAAIELLARGHSVVLAGRDAEALGVTAANLGAPDRTAVLTAPLDDDAALRTLVRSAPLLIHCAGPYRVTGPPLLAAAVEAGCQYLDHAVEAHHVRDAFERFGEAAEKSGVLVVPGMSFYGGLGDLLAGAVAEGLAAVNTVRVGYAVSGWRMTTGARRTAELLINEVERITWAGGAQRVGPLPMYQTEFAFAPPLGPREMIGPFPTGDAVTIPRHVPTGSVEVLLTGSTFTEPDVFTSEHVDAPVRAGTDFTVAVEVTTDYGTRSGELSGRDIWWAGVVASVEAAVQILADPRRDGVLSPAEAFVPRPFLRRLADLGVFDLDL